MKQISQEDHDKLLEYLDGTMSADEKARFEHSLASEAILRDRLEELRSVHRKLSQSSTLQEPSRNFTQLVMSKLDQYPLTSGFSTKNTILLLAGVMIAIGIGAILLSAGVFDSGGSIELTNLVIHNDYLNIDKQLPAIPINGKLIVNIIIGLNLALAFLVIDRAILKPWFEKRTKMNY